ncbi:hypothetical protein [Natronolimnohabitans innermongolicus]|uniref:DUF7981 domain-containing protein n=1 Tax=Natronolimnohabitans innermongolicus JCM 12255 TaxID=1227499 RepID=L9WTK3_9EURY|nr:hypothetical protein [Natronolimnohabitans innermongolicus]ELY52531.1 hypothetical protein C493_15820 [Natronolimnohabitans innermongolicus JCM 12255]
MSVLGLRPRVKAALLWGAVGSMAFLVLVQGYALLVDPLVSLARGAAIAVLVGAMTTGCAYRLEHRVAEWAARRARRGDESHGVDGKSKS